MLDVGVVDQKGRCITGGWSLTWVVWVLKLAEQEMQVTSLCTREKHCPRALLGCEEGEKQSLVFATKLCGNMQLAALPFYCARQEDISQWFSRLGQQGCTLLSLILMFYGAGMHITGTDTSRYFCCHWPVLLFRLLWRTGSGSALSTLGT